MGKGPLEKALTTPLGNIETALSGGIASHLGHRPQGNEADTLVSCLGCGAVFVKSKVAKDDPSDVAIRPNPKLVLAPTTTCPCCLQTQGWREIADVKFRSVDTP